MTLARLRAVALAAVTIFLSGCGESGYDLVPISGVVEFNGKPLAHGVVNFQPIAKEGKQNAGPGSTGITDEQGRYVLKTFDGEEGAVVGEDVVRIYSRNPEGPPPAQDSDPRPAVELIPARFNYQSTLKQTVPPEGNESLNFTIPAE